MSRAMKELRGLMPFAWDSRVGEHPVGSAAMRDFQDAFGWSGRSPRTPGASSSRKRSAPAKLSSPVKGTRKKSKLSAEKAANNAAAKQDVKVTSLPADVAIVATSSVESDGVPPLPKHKITEVDFPETPAAQMLISKQGVRTDGAASGTVVSSSAVVTSPGSGCPAGEGTVRKAIQMPALTPARPGHARKTLETASAPLTITACTPIARSNPDAHFTAPPSQLLLTPVAAAAPPVAVSAGETAAAVTAAAEPFGGGFGSPVEAQSHASRACRTSLDSETLVEGKVPLVTEGGAHNVGESVPKGAIISTPAAIVGISTGDGNIASPPPSSSADELVGPSTVMVAPAEVVLQELVRAGGCVIMEIGIEQPVPGKEVLLGATGGGDGMSGDSLAAEAMVAAPSAEGSTHLNQRAGLLLAVAQVITQSPAVRHQKRRRMSELTPIRLPAIREESLSPLCPSTRIQLQPNVDSVQVLQPLKTLVSNPPPTKPGSSFRSAPIAGSVSGLRLSSPPDTEVATGNVAAGSHSPAPDRAVALRPWQAEEQTAPLQPARSRLQKARAHLAELRPPPLSSPSVSVSQPVQQRPTSRLAFVGRGGTLVPRGYHRPAGRAVVPGRAPVRAAGAQLTLSFGCKLLRWLDSVENVALASLNV